MSALHGTRPGELSPESAVRLWVEAANRHHGLDPLYRRRLRGRILNGFVAAHEAPAVAVPSRRMGVVGRSVLTASVAVALSVGGAIAASGAAVPGDALYPLKRQIEELRAAILPAQFDDVLAVYAFAERTEELARLIEAGDTARATAFLPEVRASYERLLALRPELAQDSGVVGAQISVLYGLLNDIPTGASADLQDAIEPASSEPGATPPGEDASRQPPGHLRPSNGKGVKGTPGVTNDERSGRGPADEPSRGSGGRGPEASDEPSPKPSTVPELPPENPEDESD